MDFFQINAKVMKKEEGLTAYPDFIVGRSDDLMVRAKNFYAIWDEPNKIWSTDEYKVQQLVDAELAKYKEANPDVMNVKWMRSFGSNGQSTFRKYLSQIGDHYTQLDEQLTFLSTKVEKKDYVSKRLPYDLASGDISGWETIVSTLYKPSEREKIEWFIGSIVSGDSKTIQKFLVLFGPPGAGKGTIITIVEKLFPGYIVTFKGKELGGGGQFASAQFASNPLVAIEHDGDMSRVEDNTLFNSIVSHELMKINEKYKPAYDARINAALIMGTNKAVKITDSQSGLLRRLIDVHPTGEIIPSQEYWNAMGRIDFQLGAIAQHCLDVYKSLGKNKYSSYKPMEMLFRTNAFFNFIQANFEIFEKDDGISAKRAWSLYSEYCAEFENDKKMPYHAFKAELGNYFEEFHDRWKIDDKPVRNYYKGFKQEVFKTPVDDHSHSFKLVLEETVSLLNLELAEYPAQYSNASGNPAKFWDDGERLINGTLKRPRPSQIVDTLLRDINPYEEHYVKVPENLICIDFDIRDDSGEKSLEKNLEAAALWPATYGELSKSGKGVHLHYYYEGEVEQLDPNYDDGIEVKVYRGNSALRRRLTKCNAVAIAVLTATSGILPLKEKKRVLDVKQIQSVAGLRRQIEKALNRDIHSSTKSNIDYIKQAVDDFYESGKSYDISDLQGRIATFAQGSSNQPIQALRVVKTIRWKSDDLMVEMPPAQEAPADDRVVFYDVEVYPNLFVVCWKFKEAPGEKPNPDNVVRMINPTSSDIEALFRLNLVGYYNRDYDNHILWGAFLGHDNAKLYQLSQRLINGASGAKFPEAYNLSYADILDFASKKQSLKKWQVDLRLEHREMDIPWDKPVPEDKIMDVVDYCVNDVVSTEAVFDFLEGDWTARLILSDLSGLEPNHTTKKHTAQIVFGPGHEKRPIQREFVYTKLDKEFPGYKYELGVSTYRGEIVGEGGLVRSKPGIYKNVGLLDIASMHPTTIGQLNLFGDEYTPRFMALVEAQLAIKRGEYDSAKTMLGGKLTPYIDKILELQKKDPAAAKKAKDELRYGLKIAINIVYGLTSAKYDNPFRDRKNVDNIVAKRGALFMVDLMFALEEAGFDLIHIKTDSVKIANYTPEALEFVKNFGDKYGYTFEEEAVYEKLALFNDAVYIAKKNGCELSAHSIYNPKTACWVATGTQFIPEANPYVFKKLFGYEINFDDLCVTKQVNKGKMYLDFGRHHGEEVVGEELIGLVEWAQATAKTLKKAGASEEEQLKPLQQVMDDLVFVGKIGRFTPIVEGYGGGQLWRIQEGKSYAVSGTKDHLWTDSNAAESLPGDAIDYGYFENLYKEAIEDIEKMLAESPFETVGEFLA